jgi:PAS domain-containing protein
VIAPLTTAQGTIGAIAVLNRAEPFTQADARILQRLGDQVSVAIANARLFEEVERATREWKVAFDSVASCLVVLDDARRIARCNRRLVELCGAPDVSAVLGASFPGVLWHDAAAHAATTLIERASAEGAVVRGEVLDDMRGRVFMLTASSSATPPTATAQPAAPW